MPSLPAPPLIVIGRSPTPEPSTLTPSSPSPAPTCTRWISGPPELGIDRAVETEVDGEPVGVDGDADDIAGRGPGDDHGPLLSLAVGPVAAPAGVANALNPPTAVAITAKVPANHRRFKLVFNILLRS